MQLSVLSHLPATGWSQIPDPSLDSDRTLLLAFGAPDLTDLAQRLRELRTAFPRAHVLGCSTAGEVNGDRIQDGSLLLAVARFRDVTLRAASAQVTDAEASRTAGQELARQLAADDLRAVLVFSDGLTVNGSALVAGMNDVLPSSVVISGGLAADGDRFRHTWVLWNDEPRSGIVSAVGLYGASLRVGHGSKGGWDSFGVERRVTRATGNVLHELDGRPALALYKEYLGERAAGLPATALLFPLALRPEGAAGESVVRTILGVDEATQSMTFAGDVPEGWLAQLMYANFDRLVEGAGDAARDSIGALEGRDDVLAIAVSCVGRRLVLGDMADEELESTVAVLPSRARLVGFYSYGELSPLASGRCELHNQTMTLTTLAEA